MSALREPVPFEVYEAGVYLHGTKADLAVGDLLVPGRESNFEAGRVMNYIYFTATLDAAVWGAELASWRWPWAHLPGRAHRKVRGRPELDRQEVPGESNALVPYPRAAARCWRACRLGRPFARQAQRHASLTPGIAAERNGADRRLTAPPARLSRGTFPNTGPDDTDHARRVQVVQLRRRPLSLARGNRDKPHLCADFTFK